MGQATVEAALTLPVVLIGLLLIVQVAVVVRDALALGLAAREGARQAAVSADDATVGDAVRRSSGPLDAGRIEITISGSARRRGEPVSVELSYVERVRIPIIDRMVDMQLPLRASATMRLERSGPTPSPTPPLPSPSPSPAPTPAPTPPP